jgi:hypothetical protein
VEAVSKGAGCDDKQSLGISRTLRYTASLRSAATRDAQVALQKREVVLLQILRRSHGEYWPWCRSDDKVDTLDCPHPDPYATDYPPIENLLPLVMCLSVAGLGLAWRWEGLGGAISVVFFLADIGLYWAIRGKFFPLRGLPILSPVLITGLLFLVCWWRTRSSSRMTA